MTTLVWTVATRWDHSSCERATFGGRTAEVWKSKGRWVTYAVSVPGCTMRYEASPEAARAAAADMLGANLAEHATPRSNLAKQRRVNKAR